MAVQMEALEFPKSCGMTVVCQTNTKGCLHILQGSPEKEMVCFGVWSWDNSRHQLPVAFFASFMVIQNVTVAQNCTLAHHTFLFSSCGPSVPMMWGGWPAAGWWTILLGCLQHWMMKYLSWVSSKDLWSRWVMPIPYRLFAPWSFSHELVLPKGKEDFNCIEWTAMNLCQEGLA